MKHIIPRRKTAVIVIILLLLLTAVALPALAPAVAQLAATYDLTWRTVDGGGQTFSTGDSYILGGTAGQADANLLTGGEYTLAGGFWPGGETVASYHYIHLPLLVK